MRSGVAPDYKLLKLLVRPLLVRDFPDAALHNKGACGPHLRQLGARMVSAQQKKKAEGSLRLCAMAFPAFLL